MTMVNFRGNFMPIEEVLTRLARRASKEVPMKSGEKLTEKAPLAAMNIASYSNCRVLTLIMASSISTPSPIAGPKSFNINIVLPLITKDIGCILSPSR